MTLLTPKEVALILKINVRTVQRLANAGELPAKRIGGQWRFVESVVRDWLLTGIVVDPRTQKVRFERLANG